jgi:hypothetical protein
MPPYGLEFPLSGNLLILGNPCSKVNFDKLFARLNESMPSTARH